MLNISTRFFFYYGIIFLSFFHFDSYSFSSNEKRKGYESVRNTLVSIPVDNVTVEQTFKKIESKTDFRFAYDKKDLDPAVLISNTDEIIPLSDLLINISKECNLKFRQINNIINVYKNTNVNLADVVVIDFEVTGTIKSAEDDQPLLGVSIRVSGSNIGVITDASGKFRLTIPGKSAALIISYVGFETLKISVDKSSLNLNLILKPDLQSLMNVVIVGTRFNARSALTSPVPIDNITTKELLSTGQLTLDQMINYKIQSYNASQQTISDATAHFNPADLRGLGPSRTLVLINGKRKNPGALVYINDTPGKGEVGVDIQSIPIGAIERVEVLRDGASAQYGSDAIAGVLNIILKDEVDATDINLFSGITTKGDGFNYGFNANTGFTILGKGHVNVTTSFKGQQHTNRAGEPKKDQHFGNLQNDETLSNGIHPWIQKNPSLGMIIGQPDMVTFDIFFNTSVPLKKKGEIYSFGGITYRNGKSFAFYRAPYWIPDTHNIYHRPGEIDNGFAPTFETDIYDQTFGVGLKSQISGWDLDLSSVSGGNSVEYDIGETLNVDLGALSPTRFYAGGYEFKNLVNNLDLYRKINNFSIGFGSEFRTENFIARAGEEGSYIGSGAQSFPGIRPSDEVDKTRYNVGAYTDLEYDNSIFLVGGAARFEKYGDFGNIFTWKINSRIRLLNNILMIRGSVSTGFRAPSLHQIYLSNIQTLVSGGTISNQTTFNNHSPAIRALGVPELKEEKSTNFSIGLTLNPSSKFELTMDYYDIKIKDRVLFTSEIGFDNDNNSINLVEEILTAFDVTSLKFFINAVDTRTQGIDLVTTYKDILIGTGLLTINFAANLNHTTIEGGIKTPKIIEASGNEIFNRKEQSRIVSSRPANKFLLGFLFEFAKFNALLNFTRFGEVIWRHADIPANDQVFTAKIITDINISYKITKSTSIGFTINNLMNIYPDELDPKDDPITNVGGRFKYAWEVNQFGFLGTVVSGKIHFRF